MITETVNYLANRSPRVRRFIWRHAYQSLNRMFAEVDWHFLNYGYASLDSASPRLTLDEGDEPDRVFMQLYHHVAESAGLAGKEVLEVSSGRGGGSAFMAKYMSPRYVTGMDGSERAVAYSARHHGGPNLTYCVGDAEALPFPAATFDVVVNVEASHCYGSMARFLQEVRRVLRPQGWFVMADVRASTDIAALDEAFAQAELSPVRVEDITANVLASLDEMNERKVRIACHLVPRPFVSFMLEFAGVRGSTMYEELVRREKRYLHYACRKV